MSPAMASAMRALIEEIYLDEVKIARMNRNLALVRSGVHPSLPLIGALIDWGTAVRCSTSAKPEGGTG